MTGAERAQLKRVAAAVRDVLGEAAVAAWLYGSATLGGLKPESDLDVLALAARRLSGEEKRALGARMLALTKRPRRLELTVVALPELRPWRFPPRLELQYGDWLRAQFERGEVEPERPESTDLTILLSLARRSSVPLFGPAAGELLEPVPADDLAQALDAAVEDVLRDLDGDTRNVLLTLARVWCTAATGEIRAKDEAAAWALERLPPEEREPLARARAIYLGEEEERWDDLRPGLAEHAALLVRAIRT